MSHVGDDVAMDSQTESAVQIIDITATQDGVPASAESVPVEVTNITSLGSGTNADNNEDNPKKRKALEPRSGFWLYFDKFECPKEKIQKARCKYCLAEIKADPRKHGTNGLKNHFKSCKKIPREVVKSQMQLNMPKVFIVDGDNKECNSSLWKFDELKSKRALSIMVIVDELPFRIVEHIGFNHFVSTICPQFCIPSRKTLAKNIFQLYLEEKFKLKCFLKETSQRVCITTDTWTSIQRINYMSLTVHFIDNEWKLHKKILNFCPITSHKGEEIGKGIEKCIREWGIEKIFTVTVDNASSNDTAVSYLKKKMDVWRTSILGNQHVHMRCIAHIINLVVQDGMKCKDEHEAIDCIRGAVKYIKSSTGRYQSFLKCVEMEYLETKKLLSLDVPTRWNSTYLMLQSAVSLRKAFVCFEEQDDSFKKDLEKAPYTGVPSDHHWERATMLMKFLGSFYDLTLKISGSSYVTSNLVFHEICAVDFTLKEWVRSDDSELREMAKRMKQKLDKYWGSVEKMNKLLYFAVILDPRHKLEYLDYCFDEMYDSATSTKMKKTVKEGMIALFNEYKKLYGDVSSSSTTPSVPITSPNTLNTPISDSGKKHRLFLKRELKKKKSGGEGEHVKSELERYLAEEVEDEKEDDDSLDILQWWKANAHRFPILSKLARDVLAVPVSTVASEAAFSAGGRTLDSFRSSLLPRTVQALICAQNWLRTTEMLSNEEDIEQVHKLEQEFAMMNVGSNSNP